MSQPHSLCKTLVVKAISLVVTRPTRTFGTLQRGFPDSQALNRSRIGFVPHKSSRMDSQLAAYRRRTYVKH